MFVTITPSGRRCYVKLVQSYRDTSSVPCQQVVATRLSIGAVRSGEAETLPNGRLLYRLVRTGRKAKVSPISPEPALEIARRFQCHQMTLHQRQLASSLSAITPHQQKELFDTTALPEPSAKRL